MLKYFEQRRTEKRKKKEKEFNKEYKQFMREEKLYAKYIK